MATNNSNTKSTSTTVLEEGSYENVFGLLQPNIADSHQNFATESDFKTLHETQASPWRNLPLNVIYHIQHIKKVHTKNGQEALILYLYERNSTQPLIHWATSVLTTELQNLKELKNLYIKSMGLRKSLSGRDYYSYQLLQKQ